MSPAFRLSVEKSDFIKALQQIERPNGALLVQLLHTVGFDTVAYLRSLTSEMRPPARAGESMRKAHPGHWADITGALANGYGFEVKSHGDDGPFELIFFNTVEYAAYLEAKEGYFVLSGVTDSGGPLETALKRVIGKIPGWRLEIS